MIEEREAEAPHSVVCVMKKDGVLRLCADFRALNAVTKTDDFPMENPYRTSNSHWQGQHHNYYRFAYRILEHHTDGKGVQRFGLFQDPQYSVVIPNHAF